MTKIQNAIYIGNDVFVVINKKKKDVRRSVIGISDDLCWRSACYLFLPAIRNSFRPTPTWMILEHAVPYETFIVLLEKDNDI